MYITKALQGIGISVLFLVCLALLKLLVYVYYTEQKQFKDGLLLMYQILTTWD